MTIGHLVDEEAVNFDIVSVGVHCGSLQIYKELDSSKWEEGYVLNLH